MKMKNCDQKAMGLVNDQKSLVNDQGSFSGSLILAAEGFADASALLAAGVFCLVDRGEIVYVGTARGPMLPKIAVMRSTDRPSFLPKIRFDQVFIRQVHPDRIDSVVSELIATYAPRFNLPGAIPFSQRSKAGLASSRVSL